jgi:NADPH-dependent glutamate synthase beta subunit-like oxidoreductase
MRKFWPTDKDVVVIGGGDTGSDCVGTSIRQGARSVTQLEIMPKPPVHENKLLTWPNWPLKLRTSSFSGGRLRARLVGSDPTVRRSGWTGERHQAGSAGMAAESKGRQTMVEVPGSEFEIKAGSGVAGHGFRSSDSRGHVAGAGRGSWIRVAMSPPSTTISDFGQQGFQRRRHAARPIAGGLGDPRRPAVRSGGGRIFDGQIGFTALKNQRGGARGMNGDENPRIALCC